MKGRKLTKTNSDFIDKFIESVEQRTFDKNSSKHTSFDTLPFENIDIPNFFDDNNEELLFLKYRFCLSQPFNVVKFNGSKLKRKEWAHIKFIRSNEAAHLQSMPFGKATLIRTFNKDYKLIFEDKSYYTITKNKTKRLFHFSETLNDDDVHTPVEKSLIYENPNYLNLNSGELRLTVQIFNSPRSGASFENANNSEILEELNKAYQEALPSADSDEIYRVRTAESIDSIIFLSTGNSNSKDILKDTGSDRILSPESNDEMKGLAH